MNTDHRTYNEDELRHIAVNYAIHCLKGYEGSFTDWFNRISKDWRKIANLQKLLDGNLNLKGTFTGTIRAEGLGDEFLSTELHINPNAGSIRIGKPQRTITITIERNNELTQGSEWELIDFYSNGYCLMSKWRNKTTNEEIEGIGTNPPSKRLDLDIR